MAPSNTQTAEITAEDVIVFEALRQAMKDLGFRWSPRRKKWAHNCGTPSKSARVVNPWDKYHHQPISGPSWKAAHA